MVWVNIIACLILFFSFVGGLREGAVKHFFSLIALLIAIPLAGLSYRWLAGILSFIPGENWENFLGFFITLAIISVILNLIFLLPRKFIQKVWKKGLLFRLAGAVLNIFSAAIGLTVFTIVLQVYPIFDWLERAVMGSVVLNWLVVCLGFVQLMLPDLFRYAGTVVVAGQCC
jgi:uncharacterized membrane protein required for colicin V production